MTHQTYIPIEFYMRTWMFDSTHDDRLRYNALWREVAQNPGQAETAGVLINIITKNSPLSVVSKFWLFRMATLRGLY